jgi:hypothetical protein
MADISIRRSRIRIIDWYRAISLTTTPIVVAFFLLSAANAQNSMQLISAAVCLLAVWLGWIHFGGTLFDVTNDTLVFPTLLFSRSIPLSEIRDANAASLTRRFKVLNTAIAAGGSGPKTQNVTHQIYAIDLSGNFGGRQVKFWSRKRRDQFLSVLRDLRPECRITRWASGYGDY